MLLFENLQDNLVWWLVIYHISIYKNNNNNNNCYNDNNKKKNSINMKRTHQYRHYIAFSKSIHISLIYLWQYQYHIYYYICTYWFRFFLFYATKFFVYSTYMYIHIHIIRVYVNKICIFEPFQAISVLLGPYDATMDTNESEISCGTSNAHSHTYANTLI